MFSWDEKKREANKAKHGVDFTEAEAFEFETALIAIDDRFDYGEVREIALGKIGKRVHVVVFTRRGDKLHIVSLRKANAREVSRYDRS